MRPLGVVGRNDGWSMIRKWDLVLGHKKCPRGSRPRHKADISAKRRGRQAAKKETQEQLP